MKVNKKTVDAEKLITDYFNTKNENRFLIKEENVLDYQTFLKSLNHIHIMKYRKNIIFDTHNKEFIKYLYYWFFNSPKFPGDLTQGLLIQGRVGRGKSYTLQIFGEFMQWYQRDLNKDFNKVLNYMETSRIIDEYRKKLFDINKIIKHDRINLYNDLGKDANKNTDIISPEDALINHFGEKVNVMRMVLEEEYLRFQKRGIPSIIITNWPIETLKIWYGVEIESRFYEMYNQIEMTGVDRRKQKL